MRDHAAITSVETLYDLHHRDLVRFFADHLADRDAAWDLCHEVFVRLLIALASGTQLKRPQQWLMRVAKNLLVDTYRQRRARATETSLSNAQEQEVDQGLLAGDSTTFWTLLERSDMLDLIAETFQTLPAQYRCLLYWREIERLPLQEIAVRTGTAESVLSTELWRARKLLQREYQRRRFAGLLSADEEIFGHLDALLRFDLAASPEDQLRRLETHEQDYFSRIAPDWDAYVASAYEVALRERLTNLLPWHRDMTVLDVGTGTGYLAGMIAPLAGDVIGVDCTPAMLTCAGEKTALAGHRNVTFRAGMAERLPIATGSVDVAACHMLLHHVVSPRTALREMCRVVRPGGYVVIVDAHAHKYRWTPEAFGDLHYGTDLKQLRRHLSSLPIQPLLIEDAGISHSGSFIGRDADFSNFLVLGQVGEPRSSNRAGGRRERQPHV